MTLTVRVLAPDSTVWDAEADEAILPATSGQLGILSGHAPLLTAIGTGVLRVRAAGQWSAIAVMGGFAEVENNDVTVLVKRGVLGTNVDRAEAERTQQSAESTLASSTDKEERLQAQQSLQEATSLLQAASMEVAA
ncbi:MAG: ATP synthase F1 subunit epsilon [Cyanobacteria bacterium J06639_1]